MHLKQQCMMKNNLTTTILLIILMTFTGLSSVTASSMAVADIHAHLTFTQPNNDIGFATFDSFGVTDILENGNASAIAKAPDPMNVGNGVQLSANTTATASPTGSTFAIATAFGSFDLINTTPNPIDVDFTLVYDWTIQGSAQHPSLEQALAEIALNVFINDVSFSPISEGNITPPNFNTGSGNGVQGTTITQVFSNFSIPVGTTFVEVAVAAQAEATSATVPEPSTLVLLGSGIAGLAIYQRRKRT